MPQCVKGCYAWFEVVAREKADEISSRSPTLATPVCHGRIWVHIRAKRRLARTSEIAVFSEFDVCLVTRYVSDSGTLQGEAGNYLQFSGGFFSVLKDRCYEIINFSTSPRDIVTI